MLLRKISVYVYGEALKFSIMEIHAHVHMCMYTHTHTLSFPEPIFEIEPEPEPRHLFRDAGTILAISKV